MFCPQPTLGGYVLFYSALIVICVIAYFFIKALDELGEQHDRSQPQAQPQPQPQRSSLGRDLPSGFRRSR